MSSFMSVMLDHYHTIAFLFFFQTDSVDLLDCLPILLRMSVFFTF